ncbi:MAG TPA: acyl-CoA dehydrogenase family protein, partial [Acidimicrobiales bacterium]|nr:acyl-CoA dehydrogenase family protein [Acidimicrobiales bacterium]
ELSFKRRTGAVATTEDTPAEAALRAEVRAWMAVHAAPYGPADRHLRMVDTPERADAARRWQRTLDGGGWAVPTWPEAAGGRGLTANQARIVAEEETRYAVPSGNFHVATLMVGPTLMAHGTHEQQERFLPAIRRGEHLWCQLFSEPDAGSDLASLRTRALPDGDGWVVTGQKVWTSGARGADWAILLARTEPGSIRHHGITYFLCDMRLPGVEVRPLVQINRAAHFNEVHLDGVRIPADCVLGTVGEGWAVARTTLGAERMMIGSMNVADHVDDVVAASLRTGRGADPALRQALTALWVEGAVLRMLGDRVAAAVRRGGPVGPEASAVKLGLSRFMGRLGDTAMLALGAEGLLEGGDPSSRTDDSYGPLQDKFLGQWASRIGGGTEQIQRNLIAERALGLPRDPRPTAGSTPRPTGS